MERNAPAVGLALPDDLRAVAGWAYSEQAGGAMARLPFLLAVE